MHILVINGPNMNLLGVRQPEIYGRTTYEELTAMIQDEAKRLGVKVSCFQSNHEGALIDVIHLPSLHTSIQAYRSYVFIRSRISLPSPYFTALSRRLKTASSVHFPST